MLISVSFSSSLLLFFSSSLLLFFSYQIQFSFYIKVISHTQNITGQATVQVVLRRNRIMSCFGHWFGIRTQIQGPFLPSLSPNLDLTPLLNGQNLILEDNVADENLVCCEAKGCCVGVKLCENREVEFVDEKLMGYVGRGLTGDAVFEIKTSKYFYFFYFKN
jgi:hypothetical protein